ncbi:hypothetical protein UFOVP589_3 [uncultured Caudovirales phage]|uniref:Uncharacterized protein n=1 Tax=uncultured Caudovirales phage TaxID=2100421 RepID=A0A6J5MXU4_9CAUD|nr:hypothetical protein UFOVP589_3 [uncultured Caudovirales phage]
MIDTLIAHAVSGNKSHKSKLEAVRLQIVALRAVEAQLQDWIAQSEKEQAAEEDRSTPSAELMKDIAEAMSARGLMRADAQSSEWAGLAVPGLDPGSITSGQRKHARRVIECMIDAGFLRKVSTFSGRQGRDIPSYEVCQFPTCENAGGKSGEEWGKS